MIVLMATLEYLWIRLERENRGINRLLTSITVGAGWSGMLSAVHLIEAGAATSDDVRIVDVAGGFGGTW